MIKHVILQRMTATIPGEFCVFLIGMRINRPLKFHKWLPVARSLPRMMRELEAHEELGCLGSHAWFGRTTILLQYWRSAACLKDYATNKDREHLPAWAAFTNAVGNSGDVGIWHETYTVKPGGHETIYHNMPPFGLGRAGSLIPATGHYQSARQRLTSGSKLDRPR